MYVIKDGGTYIRLNANGSAVTCSKPERGMFTKVKAENIYHSLPRKLKKFHFQVLEEREPENTITSVTNDINMCVIANNEYVPPKSVVDWVDKFGSCEIVFDEAKARNKQLKNELNDVEKEYQDVIHVIELEKSKNMYDGWKLYKDMKDLRERRRNIKDEIYVIESVMDNINVDSLKKTDIDSIVKSLSQRVYRFRVNNVVKGGNVK